MGFYAVFSRIWALVGDMALAYTLFSYLCSFALFNQLYDHISAYLGQFKLTAMESSYLPTLIFVYVLHIFLRFYATLVFGVSFSQFLMGLRSQERWPWRMFGGGTRVFFEAILGPLLVFDLPLLWGKKSVKETLSFTSVTNQAFFVPLLSSILIIPCFVVVGLFSPLLENLTLLDGIKISFFKEKKEKISNATNFENYQQINSNYFKFTTFTSLKDNRLLLLPSFEVLKMGNQKKVNPYLMVYDLDRKILGSLKLVERFSLLEILAKGKIGNPFFRAKYPRLSLVLDKGADFYQKQEYQNSKDLLLSAGVREEIGALLQTSFELSIGNVVSHLIENGPFARGYILIRNHLLNKLDRSSVPEVDIVQMGNGRFLRMQQLFDSRMVENFVPLQTNNSMLLQLEFPAEAEGQKSRLAFKQSFLALTDWYFDYYNVFSSPGVKDFTPLHILDYFADLNLEENKRGAFEDYIYEYLFQLCRNALIAQDEELQQVLLAVLNRYYLVVELQNMRQENFYSKRFVNFLKVLKVYLAARDKGYFNY